MTDSVDRLDRIHIRDLELRCIIGVNADERREVQDVRINITVSGDLGRACRSDDLADSIDYKDLKKRIISLVEGSSFLLIERLAQAIADVCLDHPRAEAVRVVVDKPGALRFVRSVGVEIERRRDADD